MDLLKPSILVIFRKNECPDCGEPMERKESGSFTVSDKKYRCLNPRCPGKVQNHEGR